ncbi:MAG: DUF3080 family protein [Pseudomonadota bacterium]
MKRQTPLTPLARLFTVVLLLGLLLAVASCSRDSREAQLKDYLLRLSRPLELQLPEFEKTTSAAPPRAASLLVELETGSLDGLDFLRLRGCALQTTIAKRNSSLGRVAPPSQRLLLELAFLRETPACIEKLSREEQHELAQLLLENYELKKTQLPQLIFNATLASPEFRDFWRSTEPLEHYPESTSSVPVAALENIAADAGRWLSGDYRAQEERFESALFQISQGDGGELLRALEQQGRYLLEADRITESRRSSGGLCGQGLEPKAAPIVRNVVTKYFAGGIQHWSAQLNTRYHALLPPIQTLEQLTLGVHPESYAAWVEQRDRALAEHLSAPLNHVRAMQGLLGSCYSEFAPA